MGRSGLYKERKKFCFKGCVHHIKNQVLTHIHMGKNADIIN